MRLLLLLIGTIIAVLTARTTLAADSSGAFSVLVNVVPACDADDSCGTTFMVKFLGDPAEPGIADLSAARGVRVSALPPVDGMVAGHRIVVSDEHGSGAVEVAF